jgi:hypothetical protein
VAKRVRESRGLNDYDERLREMEGSESYYHWRCTFGSLECASSVEGLRFGVCYNKGLGLVCPRFDEKVDVFRCHDGLPCNIFVDGFGFGECRDKVSRGKVRVCCSRFKRGSALI